VSGGGEGRRVRAKTIAVRWGVRRARRYLALPIVQEVEAARPRTRGECATGPRPCPWVGCKYHLYLDVNEDNGSIKLNHPHRELDELEETCALDVADRHEKKGVTLEHVGELMNLVRERARQLEIAGLFKVRRAFERIEEEGEE
jgi:hypothetical protein